MHQKRLTKVYTLVYTHDEVIDMLKTKTFNSGNSQAIRIPKEYRLDEEEVIISKVGSAIIVFQQKDRLAVLMESLNEFTDDFLSDGRPEQVLQSERVTFN